MPVRQLESEANCLIGNGEDAGVTVDDLPE